MGLEAAAAEAVVVVAAAVAMKGYVDVKKGSVAAAAVGVAQSSAD